MEKYFGENVPKLGFGLMRLPKLEDGKTIDLEYTKKLVDMFIEAGFTYFDTAYTYDNGESEKAAKVALVDRYPRDRYTLCTKLCAWHQAGDEQKAKQQFFTSLERTGAGFFDYYLLHALQSNNYKLYDEYGIWDFVKEQKKKGLIRYWGFSFHSTPELLDKLLTAHSDVDFIQLQINYADWDDPEITARVCYEVARKHGKSIVVMEPVKGGTLANPTPDIQKELKKVNPDASFASWAIRYAASLDGIITVLSGMSDKEQMADNISYMKNLKKLDKAEEEAIKKVQEIISRMDSIPCTGCHYCTDGCPGKIPIPEIFSARNKHVLWNRTDAAKEDYLLATKEKGKASDCISCGQCENACPQQIKIIEKLAECSEIFDK